MDSVWKSAEELMQPDYPAAHSMDTYWFAVDSEEHIGLFETGEPGPVPVDARSNEDGVEMLKHIFFAAPDMLLVNARSVDGTHAHEPSGGAGGPAELPLFGPALCLIRAKQHLSQIRWGLEVGPEALTPQGTAFPMYARELDQQAYESLHKAGA